jgi:D-beta-D-heptose 7-phosphate kinase/D-beta-D-heptose 1-phosphate adenosyltransferase
VTKVFVNGCFDILHPGHIRLLAYAKSLGDTLVVGLDSDRKVSQDKGASRPVNPYGFRAEIMAAIRYVDEVCFFDTEEQLAELVKVVSPDIMVIGSDWQGKKVVGSEHAGEVKFFDRIDSYSTTETIQDISRR